MERIFETIREYHMIEAGMRVLAAVSGGADSVCLLYSLRKYQRQLPFELRAVHVEHGLRGRESLEDADFTVSLCEKLGVPCRVVTAEVRQLVEARGCSVEEAARMERYRIFEEVREAWNCDRIAVAHNQNDQAETVLWNLVRGSGIRGLGGIRPVRDRIIRPLLFQGRPQIEQLLEQAGLEWRTDRTNLETDYTRNRIRLSILPQMEQQLNRQAVLHIAQAAGQLQRFQEELEHRAAAAAGDCLCEAGTSVVIRLEPLDRQDQLVREELFKMALARLRCGVGLKDVGSVHIAMLERLSHQDCGRAYHLPGGVRAVREDGILRLRLQEESGTAQTNGAVGKEALQAMRQDTASGESGIALDIDGGGIWHVMGYRVITELLDNSPQIQKEIQQEKKCTKWLSYDTIVSNVRLRTRLPGDYLVINEQGGRKKLKDYLIDLKIPRDRRDQILLAADGSRILWVVGWRISEDAKVRPETRQVIRIQIEEEEHERKG